MYNNSICIIGPSKDYVFFIILPYPVCDYITSHISTLHVNLFRTKYDNTPLQTNYLDY